MEQFKYVKDILDNKNSFKLYYSQYEQLSDLNYEEKGIIFDSIFKYEMNGEEPTFEDIVKDKEKQKLLRSNFKSFKLILDVNREQYKKTCEKNRKAQNSRWEKEKEGKKYSDRYIYIANHKISYNEFISYYKVGFKTPEGESLSFGEIFEDQLENYSDIDSFKKYKCDSSVEDEVADYYSSL